MAMVTGERRVMTAPPQTCPYPKWNGSVICNQVCM